MGKIFAFFVLFFLIAPIFSPVSAAAACSSAVGITPTVIPPSPIPEGTTSISVRFDGGITPAYYYRLRFDNGTTDYVQATGNSVTIPIRNTFHPDSTQAIQTKLQRGTHISTLEETSDPSRESPHDLCGDVTYTVGFNYSFNDCILSFSPPNPTNNQQFIVTAKNSPAGTYSVVLRGRKVGDITIGPTGEGSVSIGPFSDIGPAPVELVFGYLLPGQIGFCQTDTLVISASGGATPTIFCSIIPLTTPGGEAKILATNLQQNTFYHARLDNNFTSQQNTGSNTSLELSLGSNIPPGNHSASIHDLSGQNLCEKPLPISGTGIVTPSSPPGGSGGGPAGPPAEAGGIPCGTDDDPGFKTAVGCIHTSPLGFTKDLLKFGLGIGGGLAFLMMLLGAFQMLTSAGNPETLAAGKDRLTNAVIGLLFVIFSVLLLQIIGIGILDIPGFG